MYPCPLFCVAASQKVSRSAFALAVELKCKRTLTVPRPESSRALALTFLGVSRAQSRLNSDSRKAAFFVDRMSRSEIEAKLRVILTSMPAQLSEQLECIEQVSECSISRSSL